MAARPRALGCYWREGDAFLGDPPHEKQGWYSVWDTDVTTLQVLGQGLGVQTVPPTPPWPPTPPMPPPHPPKTPACHSGIADDVTEATCESWCADHSHCTYCKCRTCEKLGCRNHLARFAG